MLHKKRATKSDDRLYSIQIKLQNIKEHMQMITQMIDSLEKEVRMRKLTHHKSEGSVTEINLDDVYINE